MDFLYDSMLGMPIWSWLMVLAITVSILVIDLGIVQKHTHGEINVKQSLILCSIYFAIAMIFGGWFTYYAGTDLGMKFFTGYVIEFSLSIDNIFVISMIFSYFMIPQHLQRRVLFWGILGAIIMRGIMILLGAQLIESFSWVLLIFGAFLIFTGVKMMLTINHKPDMDSNKIVQLAKKYFNIKYNHKEEHFFVKDEKNHWHITPLFLALIVIELTDVVFAIDSVPAIFSITTNTFVVYTSNIFAILGLRSLYFLLAASTQKFHYLKHALSVVLVFVGAKVFLVKMGVHLPTALSLGATIGILASGVIFSIYKAEKKL